MLLDYLRKSACDTLAGCWPTLVPLVTGQGALRHTFAALSLQFKLLAVNGWSFNDAHDTTRPSTLQLFSLYRRRLLKDSSDFDPALSNHRLVVFIIHSLTILLTVPHWIFTATSAPVLQLPVCN